MLVVVTERGSCSCRRVETQTDAPCQSLAVHARLRFRLVRYVHCCCAQHELLLTAVLCASIRGDSRGPR